MVHFVTLLCKYGEVSCFVRLGDSICFDEVIDSLCRKWRVLNRDSVFISCCLPGHAKCVVDCDSDLVNVVSLAHDSGEHFVDATVCERDVDSGDDYEDEDNLRMQLELDFDNESNALSTYCSHKPKKLLSEVWAHGITAVGQCFEGGVLDFRNVLSKFSIELGFEYSYLKNDSNRVTAVCKYNKVKGCKWRVHARSNPINEFFYIKELVNIHTCGAAVRTSKNSRMSSNLVASEIIDTVRDNNGTRPVHIVRTFKTKYGQDITYNHAWLGVEKARIQLFGDYALSFDQLRWYVSEVERTNPGSRLVLDFDPFTGRFKRLFVAFHACIEGFNYCRAMLFLDGTFLKGRFKGNLLGATGKDGDQGLYPFAFAVVDSETYENWVWFLEQLRGVLCRSRTLTFISDRNLGLVKAVKDVFPDWHHAYCLHHLKGNLRTHLGGKYSGIRESLVNKFGACAYVPTVELFEKKIEYLKKEGGKNMVKFLDDLPVGNWNNAYFRGKRYGEMWSNVAESFNSWIKDARFLPVTKMVDSIRLMVMNQMAERRADSLKWNSDICPKMDKRLVASFDASKSWLVRSSTDYIFEVLSDPSNTVDLRMKWCSCHQWQLKGFPCLHAVAAIKKSGRDLNDFVEVFFHVSTYHKAYAEPIYPIATVEMPDPRNKDPFILPPFSKKHPGRPRKKRIPSKGEKVKQIKCGRCGRYGNHNRKTCNEPLH